MNGKKSALLEIKHWCRDLEYYDLQSTVGSFDTPTQYTIIVIKDQGASLFGRNWLKA